MQKENSSICTLNVKKKIIFLFLQINAFIINFVMFRNMGIAGPKQESLKLFIKSLKI